MAQRIKIRYKEINLVNALHSTEQYEARQKKRGRPSWVGYLGAVLVVLIAAGAFSWLLFQRAQLTDENDELLAQLNSPLTAEQVETFDQLTARNSFLMELRTATAGDTAPLQNAESQYAYYKSDMFMQLARQYAGRITMTSFSLSDNQIIFGFIATAAESVPEFIEKVRAEEIFDDVQYTGWSTEDGASFTLSCVYSDVAAAAETVEGGAQ